MAAILPLEAYRQLVIASGYSRLVLRGERMRCSLCEEPTKGWSVATRRRHYRQHWKAAEKELAALASLTAIRIPGRVRFGWEDGVRDAVYEIFGFPPCGNTAITFWKGRR